MTTLFDARLNEFQGSLDAINGLTLTDARTAVNTLNSLGSVTLDIVGKATLMVHLNVTVALNASTTIIIEGTVDGSNFFQVPFFVVQASAASLAPESIANIVPGGTLIGQYLFCTSATGFRQMRVRMNAFSTAGTAIVAMRASTADYRIYAQTIPSLLNVSQAPGANTGGTITLPAAGAGLFHYITNFQATIAMNPATAQTGAAPVFITTTNLPGTPAWAVPIAGNTAISTGGLASAGLVVADTSWANPLKSSASNTSTTFVLPAPGAACTIRGNVQYYVGQ